MQNTRFRGFYTSFGCETETGVVRISVIFQEVDCVQPHQGKALLDDEAEHRSILKNNQNANCTCLIFISKTVSILLHGCFVFNVESFCFGRYFGERELLTLIIFNLSFQDESKKGEGYPLFPYF